MKINLRKADAIQKAITESIKSLDLSGEVVVSEFETNVSVFLAEAENTFNKNLDLFHRLTATLYFIRGEVGYQNWNAGISARLSTIAMLEKEIGLLTGLSTKKLQTSVEQIEKQIVKSNERPVSVYGSSSSGSVVTTLITAEFADVVKKKLAELKRKRQEYKDELLTLNVSSYITLNETSVAVLREVGIVE